MAWYSILPPQLIYLESWAAKVFFVLGILTIVPWASLLIFDIGLYIGRLSLYEFPVVGGRARGLQRPRPPRLNERPRPRFGTLAAHADGDERESEGGPSDSTRSAGLKRRSPNRVSG